MIVIVLVALAGDVGIATTHAHARTNSKTIVSIEFDDGTSDQYAVRSILRSRGMHATFFVNSGQVGVGGFMTWLQLHALASDGNEIGGHTISHADLPTLDGDEATREICNDRVTLTRQGFALRSFAYPYGHNNVAVQQIVRDCGYSSGRGVAGIVSPGTCDSCPYAEEIPPAYPYVTRTPANAEVDADDSTSGQAANATIGLGQLQGFVSQGEQHGGGWVQLVFHRVCDAREACGRYTIAPSELAALLDWLRPRANRGTIVRTVGDVIGGPVRPTVDGPPAPEVLGVQNPSFEAGGERGHVPDCWMYGSAGSNTATWTRTKDARTGRFAQRVVISKYTSGDRKIVQLQDGDQCAPSISPGVAYRLSEWYRGAGKIAFTIFTRNATGAWVFCQQSPDVPPSTKWTEATFVWRQPEIKESCGKHLGYTPTAISFGLTLSSNGSLTVDDAAIAAQYDSSTGDARILLIALGLAALLTLSIAAETVLRRRRRTDTPPPSSSADAPT